MSPEAAPRLQMQVLPWLAATLWRVIVNRISRRPDVHSKERRLAQQIAKHIYGDANSWHRIYDANRDKVRIRI